jgi:inhibitor of cysteine peptidase
MVSNKLVRTSFILILPAAMCCSLYTSSQSPAARCRKHDVLITDKDNGKKAVLQKNARLVLKLEARPGTGYSWQVSHNDPDKLRQEGEPTMEKPDNDMLNGVEYEVFRFTGVSQGNVRLELNYLRSWEKGAPPAKTFAVDVKIVGD